MLIVIPVCEIKEASTRSSSLIDGDNTAHVNIYGSMGS